MAAKREVGTAAHASAKDTDHAGAVCSRQDAHHAPACAAWKSDCEARERVQRFREQKRRNQKAYRLRKKVGFRLNVGVSTGYISPSHRLLLC